MFPVRVSLAVFLKSSLHLLANASHFVFGDLRVAMDTRACVHILVIVGNRRCRVANACLSYLWVADYCPEDLLAMKACLQSIEATIGGTPYQHPRVNQWTSSVVELCLGQLSKLGKPFKYIGMCSDLTAINNQTQTAFKPLWKQVQRSLFMFITLSTVNCIIMQKNGAGLQTANTCFWDNSTDGNIKHM